MSSVLVLILANVAGYALEQEGGDAMLVRLALWPLGAGFLPWQLLSYAFLHANPAHLIMNMAGLWMFGRELDLRLGRPLVFKLYFASVLSAAVAQLAVSAISGERYPTIGASGGVFGILLAYAMCFPDRKVMLLFPPIPMPARLFVGCYAVAELVLGVAGTEAGVAHFAHLGGMAGAYAVVRRARRRAPVRYH